MFISILLNKLKHLALFFVGIFRRALCCFRRRRRSSVDSVQLTHVGVVSNSNHAEVEHDWNWEDKPEYSEPKTVQDHIELYRKKAIDARQAAEMSPEEQLDFFDDMAPRITRQTKVLINTDRDEGQPPNRLNLMMATASVPLETGELREWEESSGWEGETLDWDAQEALREKRRQDRERRMWEQQQKRQEKTARSLGSRVAT